MTGLTAEQLFYRALELADSDREPFLARVCAENPGLRAEVESLLCADRRAEQLLQLPTHTKTSAPTVFGRYPIEGELGRGGMGVVYLATDSRLRRKVALKVLPQFHGWNSAMLSRFEREGQLLAAINHPNIATVYSLEEADGVHFITMEVVLGQTLSELTQEGPLPGPDQLTVFRQISSALESAHANGVMHRDLKPQNIIVTPHKVVKILDFGLAKSVIETSVVEPHSSPSAPTSGEPTQTVSGSALGTPGYMAPEQIRGEQAGLPCDLWTLGCVMYRCLTGREAFPGQTITEVMSVTLLEDPDWSLLPGQTPERIRDILSRCLEKDATLRTITASNARKDIETEIEERRFAFPARKQETALDPSRTNLPYSLSSFIGRDRELAELASLLGRYRIVTLTGSGGGGKTRLALELGRSIVSGTPDGVWLVELASISDGNLVPQAVATSIGVREQPGKELLQGLIGFLGGRECVLLLDNCEHVLAATTKLVHDLLRRTPTLRVLCTSREPLRVEGEAVFRVRPLSQASPDSVREVEEIETFDAARLFLQRAQAANPDFELTRNNCAAVATICYRLDGVPLALELAAAELKDRTLDEIVSGLDERFRLLTQGPATSVPHHQTLSALIGWSYEMLDEKRQALFRRISALAPGWSLEAVEEICSFGGLQRGKMMELIQDLIDKSLLEATPRISPSPGAPRYRMLETIREFAGLELQKDEARAELIDRRRAYYLRLAEERGADLIGPDQLAAMLVLDEERPNLQLVLQDEGRGAEALDERIRIMGAIGSHWIVRGYWSEGIVVCERLLGEASGSRETTAGAYLRFVNGNLHLMQGDMDAAVSCYESATAVANEIGDKRTEARATTGLGSAAIRQNDLERAQALLEKSLPMNRAVGNRDGEARCLNEFGRLYKTLGNLEQARSSYEESLAIHRELGDERSASIAWNNLGDGAAREGRLEDAAHCFEECGRLARRLGDTRTLAVALHNLGDLTVKLEQPERGQEYFLESLLISRSLGNLYRCSLTLMGMAEVAKDLGDHHSARARYKECLEVCRREGYSNLVGVILGNLGDIERLRGFLDESKVLQQGALQTLWDARNLGGTANSMESLARIYSEQGSGALATQLLSAADVLRIRIEEPPSPDKSEKLTSLVCTLRNDLTVEVFDRAWARGRADSFEEVLQRALNPSSTPGAGLG